MTSDGNDDESGLELCLGLSLGGNKSSKSKEKEREKEIRFAVEDRDGFGGGHQDKDSHEEHGGSGDKERDCGMEMVVLRKTRSLDGGSNSNSLQAGNNGEQKHAETQKRQEARKKRKMLLEEQKQMKKAKKEDERPGLATKDRGTDSESGATESADDPRKANVPDLTHPQKVKNEEGGASGKMGSPASVSAPLTAGKTTAGMTYPHNPAFPLMHVPYPFPITVPAAAAAGGVPFSLPFPFPYLMQFAPAAANGEGSQEPQINPNMPNPFQIAVPPVYSPFQIQPPEGPAAWTPAMLRPQLTPPHSPPTNGDENVAEEEKGTSWRSLGVGRKELCLQLTLPTGQSFRWKQTGPSQYTGVVGMHLVSVRQTADDDVHFRVHSVSAPLKDVEREIRGYFNLDTSLVEMWTRFTEADSRFAAVAPYMLGARLLRQAPVECVFQFICSSNNHLQRIASMVDYLSSHGPYLGSVNGIPFHAFPSLEQLATLSELELRNAGFGYRAKYIVGAVELLQQKADGGEHWLCSLRQQPLDEAVAALCSLPGIGPKVAACIALFSLDQHHAIPVDTHVWQIAVRYLLPELEGRKLTPKLHRDVSEAFVKRFGMYAGWAHTVLFIAELSSQQSLLPLHLRSQNGQKRAKKAAS
ncbi:unnamed protein product [Sphagnum troendelagicum]|uniref:DNA-(apurinic or apyrimidinic site) lyase n=1 Tax=Sphagnum troendelagicum TaxID=128251 RepID=A0ABP0TJP6_9BRYO